MGLGAGHYWPFEESFRDKGGEIGRFRVFTLPIAADVFDDNLVKVVILEEAVVAAVLGQAVEWSWDGLHIINPVANASSASAQRENKLLIRYHDVTTLKKLTATIPTINLPGLTFLTEAQDFVSLAAPTFMVNLVAAWANAVVNPETGNLTVVDSAEFVGRNS